MCARVQAEGCSVGCMLVCVVFVFVSGKGEAGVRITSDDRLGTSNSNGRRLDWTRGGGLDDNDGGRSGDGGFGGLGGEGGGVPISISASFATLP